MMDGFFYNKLHRFCSGENVNISLHLPLICVFIHLFIVTFYIYFNNF